MITIEDKRRICARLFFTDNRDQYEDYHEALAEFMSGSNASEEFVDFAVEPIIKAQDGHVVLVNDEGHVATVREADGFFSPRTEVTADEGEAFENSYDEASENYPDIEGIALLEKIGWRVAETPNPKPGGEDE